MKEMPADVPLFTFHGQSVLLLWLAQNSRLLSATVLALLLSLGTMSIIRNIHDILRMRRFQARMSKTHFLFSNKAQQYLLRIIYQFGYNFE